ncbi:MAG: HAMP domain-containing histidine kinase [Caulobacteraceae bacterium]|nr:HAMP domain-containing histidine kinase [Caulobacter sp.]
MVIPPREPAMAETRLIPDPTAEAAPDERDDRRDRRRRSFLRVASHELRTPLNAVIGFSEILAGQLYGELADPRYREHAAAIHEGGLRLLKLVDQVLDIARLELGAMELETRAEPVAVAFETAARAVADAAAREQVTVTVHVAPGAAWVAADGRGLAAALSNLLRNAVAASPVGERVRLEAHLAEDGLVALEVRDRGCGVEPEQVRRFLRPFEEGEAALERADGAGLGLPITQLLCDAMGGRLRLRPAMGGGLVAAIHLPVAQAPVAG